jgi:tRNA(fMet)-specific endonuclease VapC
MQALTKRKKTKPNAQIALSVIVSCELLFGLQKTPSQQRQAEYDALIPAFDVLALAPNVATAYGNLRANLELAGKPLSANDLLIAAHAISLNATLVSADEAFANVPHLKLENWLVP